MPSSVVTELTTSNNTKPLLILVDGHSLAFRAYYALSNSRRGPLITSTGIPTSICFGFLNSLLQLLEIESPQFMAIAFDLGEPTFRHEADENYKSDRTETPEDFIPDMINLQQLLTAFNLTIATQPGYEADDVLGTIATRASDEGYRVKIVSGDRDLFQLVDDERDISVLYLHNQTFKKTARNYTEFDRAGVVEKMGVTPEQIVDYKAFCGDKSDCIPGIKGIGDKTAVKLLNEYPTLEEVYENIDKIKGATKKRLETGKEDALHSRFLAQIELNCPVKIDLDNCKLVGFGEQEVLPILKQLELKKTIDNLSKLQLKLGGEAEIEDSKPKRDRKQPDNGQLSLFADPTETEPKEKPVEIFTPQLNTQIIDTETKLKQLISTLKKQINTNKPVAWDMETTSLETHLAELVGIGCCWGNKDSDIAYIPINHQVGKQLAKELVLSSLKPILEDVKYPKSLQNAKFDRLVLHHQGIKLSGVVFDTMLASYVLNPEMTHNLGDLSERYELGIKAKSYKELGLSKKQTIADLDILVAADYCGLDCYAAYYLTDKLKAELSNYPQLSKLLLEVEQPLEPVLAIMEETGISLDIEYLQQFSQKLNKDLQKLERDIYTAAGEEFNLSSPKQLSVILFEKLGLDVKKSRKTKTGYSTNQQVLEKLKGDHPVIDNMLEYRTLAKLKSTYVDALPALVRKSTNRVHTNFNQTVVATGRLSSSNPNLQNIPIRTEFSRQIRQAFLPQSGWLLVAADYSQIELRILAHLSQEPVLLDAYQNNKDVHTVTAQLLFEKEDITSEERRLGKIINFGVIYGMGAQRFSRESGFKTDIGKEFIDKYRQKYALVFQYLDSVKKQAIALGYVTTILGRRRYVNLISDQLKELRGINPEAINLDSLKYSYTDAQILRAAANSPIQGSSADIIKIATIKLQNILQDYQARLLIQVHDELVLEVPPEEWTELQPMIKSTMENAVELSIPLLVDINMGKNWMEAK
ncbi:DNA polymerase I [Waterburya agarophytonicola K14]|uniref:DNA polymerase I n=1 Tax=Waterburya agarophytonicola KI4 TaxID=2874699 RepID=A0A964FGQ1_9CYAN|nr:DNA polymerase I [Waterburya agarophytonicola]MCC0176743.1 DNA polymerase I [Waterburya agarophytonicola KI4]